MIAYILALAFIVVFVASIAQSVRERKRPLRGDYTPDSGGDGHTVVAGDSADDYGDGGDGGGGDGGGGDGGVD